MLNGNKSVRGHKTTIGQVNKTTHRQVEPFVFAGFPVKADGYGYATIKIAEAFEAIGALVDVLDMRDENGRWGIFGKQRWTVDRPVLAMCPPDQLPFITAPKSVNLTMFEATRLPGSWVKALNRHAQACIVPCAWNVSVFQESGVTIPIHRVPLGVDQGDYWLIDRRNRPGDRPYTFLWSGTPDRRKGWDIAYRAFWHAFRGSKDVRLVLHFRKLPKGVCGCLDDNVKIVEGKQSLADFRRLMWEADCFVFPSRGEGWGLPPREAAATGLPVIATNWGGLAEDINAWAIPLRIRGTTKADYGFWEEDIGEWAEPDREQLAELMLWCVENREEAAAFGEKAADWVAEHYSWERTAKGLLDVLASPRSTKTARERR